MIVQFVKFETSLSEAKALADAREREVDCAATPGLLQKYYLKLGEPNHFGGLRIRESRAAMAVFAETDLAKTIPTAYKVVSAPAVDIHEMLLPLRQGIVHDASVEAA